MGNMKRFFIVAGVLALCFFMASCVSTGNAKRIKGTKMYMVEGDKAFGESDTVYHEYYLPNIMVYECKVYISGSDLKMRCAYEGPDWIFFDKIVFSLDGKLETFDVSRRNKLEEVRRGGNVVESITIRVTEGFLWRMGRADVIKIRFSGRNRKADRDVSYLSRVARDTLEYYKTIKK